MKSEAEPPDDPGRIVDFDTVLYCIVLLSTLLYYKTTAVRCVVLSYRTALHSTLAYSTC